MNQFAKDVNAGLSAQPKFLSSKYFYDTKGSKLFQQIMKMPEYYLTDCETDIFDQQSEDIIKSWGIRKDQSFEVIELGAGDGTKTIYLLEALMKLQYQCTYLPIDISQSALDGLVTFVQSKVPNLDLQPKQGDYFSILEQLSSSTPKVILFIGSNLGNLNDEQAKTFVQQLTEKLNPKDMLLLGLDQIKAQEIVLPAYNDPAGITKAFNLNLFDRMNDQLDANFDINQWEHAPQYTEEEGIARSFLKSTLQQRVTIGALDKTFDFEAGETIHMETSRKYNQEILEKIISSSGLELVETFTDDRAYFCDYILQKQ